MKETGLMMALNKVELLAPAGDFETALAAFDAGADAVYCGLSSFSARAFAKNFTLPDLENLMRLANVRGKSVYVTVNTVIDEADISEALRLLSELDRIKPTALIIQDIGLARLCRKYFPSLELHASTQLVAHNLEGVLALKDLGFTRVVLARELSLEEISSISKRCGGVELESFIHGALCYSISGLCLFSAMEKDRSGNRGRCAYCCRLPVSKDPANKTPLAFSMKDLRLGEDVRLLVNAGVASLKIEGRMKSALYVACVVKYYRAILDGNHDAPTLADLETVYSRRTTKLYLHGRADGSQSDIIDSSSLGHLGTPIGNVKRVTLDREGRSWLRFHTSRALEKHDGLQFASPDGGKPLGLGISEMRTAISRVPVFEVPAGTDVEILLPPPEPKTIGPSLHGAIRPGAVVYCSMSNAVKRMFPPSSFRPSDFPGSEEIDLDVTISSDALTVSVSGGKDINISIDGKFEPAKNPDKTYDAVRKAFSKLGDTDYALGKLTLHDPSKLYAPMSCLNDLRRDLVERLDETRDAVKREKYLSACDDDALSGVSFEKPSKRRVLRLRVGQKIPAGEWDEVVVLISSSSEISDLPETSRPIRLALPAYNPEPGFHALRLAVKRFLRAGCNAWEASDLATLRMLRELGVCDITADWTLYAFNASALRVLADFGVRRVVASPENNPENLSFLSESGFDVEFLEQQSTPLFISLTRPATEPDFDSGLIVHCVGGLFVTTRRIPRLFKTPQNVSTRIDLSWGAS